MQTLTEQLTQPGRVDRFLTERQLKREAGRSPERFHGLVHRALKAGELIQIRRGLYTLADRYRAHPPHPFAVAQALMPGSYVSLETALGFHGWIPEAVYATASIVPERKSSKLEHDKLGTFTFHPLAIQRGYFLEKVRRLQLHGQSMLVAEPGRALLDLVCLRKEKWQGLSWLTEGLRIEIERLESIAPEDIDVLRKVYKQKRVQAFIDRLARELHHDRPDST